MTNLTIKTTKGEVTYTFSNVDNKWDLFSGSQEAMNYVEEKAEKMGWVYDRSKKNYLSNFICKNASNFGTIIEEEKTIEETWGDNNPNIAEFVIIDTNDNSYMDDDGNNTDNLQDALKFETKKDAKIYINKECWNNWATIKKI